MVVFIFYLYHVIHKWRQFYLFLIWMTFISFSCLLLCQGLLVLCWIKVGKSEHPFASATDLTGNVFNFYYYVVSCGLVINGLYYVVVIFLPSLLSVCSWMVFLYLVICFLCTEMIIWSFISYGLYHIDWYVGIKPSLHPTWLWCKILLMYC